MFIDLQLHSTYSDGYLTPTELARFLHKNCIKIASLTDHNTVSGLNEFTLACAKFNIKTIPGIEIYLKINDVKLNILWYNFDQNSPELHDLLRKSQINRKKKVRQILQNLKDIGFKIDLNKILDQYTHYTPINQVADDFFNIKFNENKIKKELKLKNITQYDIIKNYFHNPQIGVLENSFIDLKKIMELRKKIGGQIILNHPGKYGKIKREIFYDFKKRGLDGVEILSPHHSIGDIMFGQTLAEELNWIQSGGSDFHLNSDNKYLIKNSLQYFKIDSKYLKNINKILKNLS